MLEGIIAFAQQHTNWQFRWDRRYDYHFGHDGSIDCLISEARDPDHVALLEQLRIPVVVVSGMTAAGRLPLVTTDDREIVRLAVEHFLEIGMRRMGYVTFPAFGGRPMPRREAFVAIRKRMPPDEQPIVIEVSWELQAQQQPLEELAAHLVRLPKPIALLCHNDSIGFAVAEACAMAGLRVPRDVAILGIDDDLLFCELARPTLSSIDHSAVQIGRRGAMMMQDLLAGRPPDLRPVLIRPLRVVPRRSTDAYAFDDPSTVQAIRLIREQACDGLSVRQLLRRVPMSRTTLDARLRAAIGRTAHEEILRIRIERAKALLAESDMAMPHIAARCGFSYPSQFSFAFKREVGVTPGEYRRSTQEQPWTDPSTPSGGH